MIRACYNQRAANHNFERLTFGLIGSAAPSDLIQKKTRTPFNIGRAIDLSGFTSQEAAKLAQGLVGSADNPPIVLQEVLNWTKGQPFLTQKLCKIVKTRSPRIAIGQEAVQVGRLVERYIIQNWESQDEPEHLRTIKDRALSDKRHTSQLLGLYENILRDGSIAATQNPEQMALQLSGLIVKRQDRLSIYNRIYQAVFDQGWIDQEFQNLRPYSDAICAWQNSNYDDRDLLTGEALDYALGWAIDKSLSTLDYKFLTTSQERRGREFQKDIEELNQLLAETGYWTMELQEIKERSLDQASSVSTIRQPFKGYNA